MSDVSYPLAAQGVFRTVQGEGALLGVPMIFVRLAGCSVNCPGCDTDYRVQERVPVDSLVRRVMGDDNGTRWVWVTGGEPTLYDLQPLCEKLHQYGYRVALATAGVTEGVPRGNSVESQGFDFVSVSPHKVDETWKLRRGEQLNVVPGLNGLELEHLAGVDVTGFSHKFITPCWYDRTDRMEHVEACRAWVDAHAAQGWRLGIQAHKAWGVA